MTPLVRRALARAFILLASSTVLAAPAAAQFGFQPPTGPATAPCNPFGGFPLSLNLGQRSDGLDGISSRCGFQRMQDGLNLLAGQRAQPNGIATLDGNGLVPLSQIPANGFLPSSVPSLTITGTGSKGPIDGMSVTTGTVPRPLGDRWNEIRNVRDFGAACAGSGDDTAGMQAAVTAASAGRFALRVSGTCKSSPITIPSNVYLFSDEGASIVGLSSTDSILKINAGADNVIIRGLYFDATALTSAPEGSRIAVISQTTGNGTGRVTIENNRFRNIYSSLVFTSAVILNGDVSFVRNNFVEGTGGDALNFNQGFAHVEGNYVGRSGDGCVAFNNGARGVVSGNTLKNCALGFGAGPVGNATDADQTQSMIFANNTVESSGYGVNMGWFKYAGRVGPVNWIIANNVFRNIKDVAINYDGSSPGFAANGAITGNTIWRTGAANYDGSLSATPVDVRIVNAGGTTVSGNTLRDSVGASRASAIFAQGSPNITITGNSVAQSGSGQYDSGIFLYDTQYSTIGSNLINGALNGIKLDETTSNDYISTISGNTLLQIVYAGVSVGGSGGGFNINGNTMYSTGGGTPTFGVALGTANNDFSVQNNVIRWASGAAINNPAGKTWARYLIDGNNTGGGTVPN